MLDGFTLGSKYIEQWVVGRLGQDKVYVSVQLITGFWAHICYRCQKRLHHCGVVTL